MGQKPSSPKPGTTLRVIGAGLPRTGTSSLSLALAHLLDGPVYHGGTQITQAGEEQVQTWIAILEETPASTATSKRRIRTGLSNLTAGYAAITDSPGAQFTPELLEIYPDALVVCTVRDGDAWAASVGRLAPKTLARYLTVVFLLLPTLRYFPTYLDRLVSGRWRELYMREGDVTGYERHVYDRHLEWLRSVVPEEKLVVFDVHDGWEPLCKALGCEVPEIEFPRVNDGDAMDEFAKAQVMKGLMRWAVLVGIMAVWLGLGFMRMSAGAN